MIFLETVSLYETSFLRAIPQYVSIGNLGAKPKIRTIDFTIQN